MPQNEPPCVYTLHIARYIRLVFRLDYHRYHYRIQLLSLQSPPGNQYLTQLHLKTSNHCTNPPIYLELCENDYGLERTAGVKESLLVFTLRC